MIKSLLIVGYGSIGKRHAKLARSLMPKAKIIVLKRKLIKKQKIKLLINLFQTYQMQLNLNQKLQ